MDKNKTIIRSTTVVCVRDQKSVVIASDGQVTLGTAVIKSNANKIRTFHESIKNGFCDYDTSDIINECKTYLEQPLDSYNAEIDSSSMDLDADNMGVVSGDILPKSFDEKVDTHNISTFDDIGLPPEMDDQPEYLNFSKDKLLSSYEN